MNIVKENLKAFDISLFSQQYIMDSVCDAYYRADLVNSNKRTRNDFKISCSNMIAIILLWVLHPEDSYLSILNRTATVLTKTVDDISGFAHTITAAGLCKARKRFSSAIMKLIWQTQVVIKYYNEKGEKLWKGLRVCAADGTNFSLPKSEILLKQFPTSHGSKTPKMLACLLYDVFNQIPLDIEFSDRHGNERCLLMKILKNMSAKTLLILDRGYMAFWLLHKLACLKIQFVIRIPKNIRYKPIKKNGPNDWLVQLQGEKAFENRRAWKSNFSEAEYDIFPSQMVFRLIKTQIKGFLPRYVLTSLVDSSQYPCHEIAGLYCDRWIIENYYRDLKHVLKVEKFHSKYLDGIYQEVYAAMILTVILRDYIKTSADLHGVPIEEISFKRTFLMISNVILLLVFFPKSQDIHKLLCFIIMQNRQKKRPGRSYKRVFYKKIKCRRSKSV